MENEILKRQETWNITYDHSLGETGSYFFTQVKVNKLLFGKLCPSCERVLLPPRKFCDRCFVNTEDWVEVGLTGVIEAGTIIYKQFKSLPKPPYALVYVKMDNADTAIGNYLKNIDLSDKRKAIEYIKHGTKVKIVFKEKREGSILDFWFELA